MATGQPELIALVDPIRTATHFLPELRARGLGFVVVGSGLVPIGPEVSRDVVRAETVAAMAETLRRAGVTRVMGCVDPSLPYADDLSARMGLPCNGPALSQARRNKDKMGEAVARAGLRTPAQLATGSREAAAAWASSADYPIVVKPAASGGSDNVLLCHSVAEALDAFSRILGARNLMGGINCTVLLQEFIDGVEFAIDSVTFDGAHRLVDVFAYQKGAHNGRAFIYEKERSLAFDDPTAPRLRRFAHAALDALEVRVGASHMELKINALGEIVFIEVGARLNGGDTHLLVRDLRADGQCQLRLALDALLGQPPPAEAYATARDGVRVHVVAREEGILDGYRALDRIEALPSYRRRSLHAAPGDFVGKTTDLANDVGWFDLANHDLSVLRRDEAALDALLEEGILVLR